MSKSSLSVCVYCASSKEVDGSFLGQARLLGQRLAEEGHTLIYGGGGVGLMGEVARGVHDRGGHVIGVIPESMRVMEVAYEEADELIWTDHMRPRKAEMERLSDVFLTLPGGIGTLEELSEILVLRYLGYHDKPVLLLNQDGFYAPLLSFFDHLLETRFARPKAMANLTVVETVDGVVEELRAIAGQVAG
ncbi:LOG family protein [Mucisphaera calidilacus]|uniref:Cytokinin riboside 5'-monophosphate phosphoribohydrolase n=1 Tax=Mucisphaera calidilacus TaxID=2527982 RepID=A0A518BZK5_9BACT|nr:TIGR00730 family Rossman fold protein [Mucisphaera calidilacus]QDU72400.1 LOG family protein ORF6 in fasciation locus [Mucisphaera calidilacus]